VSESESLTRWATARQHIVLSQLAPIFLLTASIWLLGSGLGDAGLATRLAFTGILLASGILGSLVQFQAASEAMAAADDLRASGAESAIARQAVAFRPWLNVVRFVTPAIFVLVFVAELVALFG